MRKRSRTLLAGLLCVSTLAYTGASRPAARAAAGGVTLHYWMAAAVTDPYNIHMMAAIKLFEQQHPGDKIVVNRFTNADTLFTTFHAASIAGTGPDLVDLWSGLFTLREKAFLVPLNSYLSAADKAKLVGLDELAVNLDPVHNHFYGIPSDATTYMGYYNKALFAKAGLSTFPQTYDAFVNACKALKAHGILPIEDGGNPYIVATNFASFMMNTLPVSSVTALRTGKLAWTDPRVLSALTDYTNIYRGYVNKDVLTEKNPSAVFLSGKAAMLWSDGNWDLPQYEKVLGKNLGFFFIPQKAGAVSAGYIASGTGGGTSATTYGKHLDLAIDFLKDVIDPGVMGVLVQHGAIPPLTSGIDPRSFPDAMSRQLYAVIVQKTRQHKIWPLWDNYQPPAVDDALNKEFGLAITGQSTPAAALQTVESIWQTVPAGQKA